MVMIKKQIVVMFGGRSPEHDVSIVTGLQVIDALDPDLFDVVPVYITGGGAWYTGEPLRHREFYIPNSAQLRSLTPVRLSVEPSIRPTLETGTTSIFKRPGRLEFDVAILAFHGGHGEGGGIQGLLDVAGVPYTGMRTMASAVLMDKVATKRMLAETGIPLLPYHEVCRPKQGYFRSPSELQSSFPDVKFPCCIKPSHLGSSIGVARVESWDELAAVLPSIFKLDNAAILEPFVDNLVEYNVSVCRFSDGVRTSAIEKPKHTSELLDFKTKYLSGSKGKTGTKSPGNSSEGMLSLTRDINPHLTPSVDQDIRRWATLAFERLNGAGLPRVDFLSDAKTGEVWLNEINPCPGSFAYFLWQAASRRLSFPHLLQHLINEALSLSQGQLIELDPTPEGAQLFPRQS